MKNIKYYGLICFFIIISLVPINISATENNFGEVVERAKKSVVLLSMNPNDNPETNPNSSGLCSGVVIDDIGHVLTNFHCVYKQNFIKL